MSTNPNEDSIAPAAGSEFDEGPRELFPVVMWGKDTMPPGDAEMYDFRPRPEEDEPVEEVEEAPKASSAPGSALAAIYETVKTPSVDSWQDLETTASADKDSMPPKETESGSQTSSTTPETKSGKNEQPAEKA